MAVQRLTTPPRPRPRASSPRSPLLKPHDWKGSPGGCSTAAPSPTGLATLTASPEAPSSWPSPALERPARRSFRLGGGRISARMLLGAAARELGAESSPDWAPPASPRGRCGPAARRRTPGAPRPAALPPLLVALCRGSVEEVQSTLDACPDRAREPFWDHGVEPPLCCAVRHQCSADIVRLLLQHGADVEAVNSRGQTPLSVHASISWQKLDWPEFPSRVDFGLPGDFAPLVEATFPQGDAERQAWLHQSIDVAEALTEAGADPTVADEAGESPLVRAKEAGNSHLVRLWAGSDVCSSKVEPAVTEHGLAMPWLFGLSSMDLLPFEPAFPCLPIEAVAEPNFGLAGALPVDRMSEIASDRGSFFAESSPLFSGSPTLTAQDLESLRGLFAGGAGAPAVADSALERQMNLFSTPSVARRSSSPPRAPQLPGLPPLLQALCSNSAEGVREVLAAEPGAASDLFWDHDVEPPLCAAVRHGCDAEVVRLLLANGADVEATDCSGRSALSLLAATPCTLTEWRLPLGLVTSVPLPGAATLGPCHFDCEAFFASEDLEALKARSRERSLEVAEVLVEAGARPLQQDAAGDRPIDLAYSAGNLHFIRLWCDQTQRDRSSQSAAVNH